MESTHGTDTYSGGFVDRLFSGIRLDAADAAVGWGSGPRAAALSALLLAGLVTGCLGGGGGGGDRDQTELRFTAATMPSAEIGVAYDQAVPVAGGVPPYIVTLATSSDALPAGLALSSAGRLTGTPTQTQAPTLRFGVRDRVGAVTIVSAPIVVAVDPAFTATISLEGAVTPGQSVDISIQGGAPPYVAVLATDASGAVLAERNANLITYTAGASSGSGVWDVVDVRDLRGRVRSILFPFENPELSIFSLRLGQTDGWRVAFDAKRDTRSAYRTDFEAALAQIGLRAAASTGAGTVADQLAVSLCEKQILDYTLGFYGYDAGGVGTSLSLDLTVSLEAPSGAQAPAEGAVWGARPNTYNVMEVSWQPEDSILGRAYLDLAANGAIEHNAGHTSQGDALGVDIAECVRYYVSIFGPGLRSQPISAADAAELRTLYQGESPQTSRGQAIADLVRRFSYRVAIVLAHEVGHSLGLSHNQVGGSIMYPSVSFAPGAAPSFTGGEWTALTGALPGPNRGQAAGSLVGAAQAAPEVLDRPAIELRWDREGRIRCSCGETVLGR